MRHFATAELRAENYRGNTKKYRNFGRLRKLGNRQIQN